MKRKTKLNGRMFDTMTDAEKAKVIADIESQTPQQRRAQERPLNKRERAEFESFRKAVLKKRKAGRPRVGKGVKLVAVTIEKGLLKRADAYAKSHGLKRTELIARGLMAVMGEASAA